MNLKKIILITSFSSSMLLFTGCSFSNPFGIGFEHSACEDSKGLGVCGSPLSIYKNQSTIEQIQSDYLKSGIEQELFFGISKEGYILVKEERTDKWSAYSGSKWEKKIKEELEKKGYTKNQNSNSSINNYDDFNLQYKKQPMFETRTNAGKMYRDYGKIQKVWIAPYVDSSGDLVSAHDVMVVIKDPSWNLGEKTPKNVGVNGVNKIPTPISANIMKKQKRENFDSKIIKEFTLDEPIETENLIKNKPEVKNAEESKDSNYLNNYLSETN